MSRHRVVVIEGRQLNAHHVIDGHQSDRQDDVHRGTGHHDQDPLVARPGKEFVRIARQFLAKILAGHLHVPAQGDQADAVIHAAAADSTEPFAETE